MTHCLHKNADCNKHDKLLNALSGQASLGQDQYPMTILDTNNVLTNYLIDAVYFENQKKRKDKKGQ